MVHFILTSLIAFGSQAAEKISISYNGKNSEVDNAKEYTNESIPLGQSLLYINSFEAVINPDQFIKKKMKSFSGLFQDDIEPYTHQEFKRSKCFLYSKDQATHFFAGEEIYWSNCKAANKQFKTSTRSVRFWQKCKDKVLELTIKNFNPTRKITFTCNAESVSF